MLLLGFCIAFMILVLCVAVAAYFIRHNRRKNGLPPPATNYIVPKRSLFNSEMQRQNPYDPHPTMNGKGGYGYGYGGTLGYNKYGTIKTGYEENYDVKYPISPDDSYQFSGQVVQRDETGAYPSMPYKPPPTLPRPDDTKRGRNTRDSRKSLASWGMSRFSGMTAFGFTMNGNHNGEDTHIERVERHGENIPEVSKLPDYTSDRTMPLDAEKTHSPTPGSTDDHGIGTTTIDMYPTKDSMPDDSAIASPLPRALAPDHGIAQTLTRGTDCPPSEAVSNPFYGSPSISRMSSVSCDRDTTIGFQADMTMTGHGHSFLGTPPPAHGEKGGGVGMVSGIVANERGLGLSFVHSTPIQGPRHDMGMWSQLGSGPGSRTSVGMRRGPSPHEDSNILPNGLAADPNGTPSVNGVPRSHFSLASSVMGPNEQEISTIDTYGRGHGRHQRDSQYVDSRYGTLNSVSTYRASTYVQSETPSPGFGTATSTSSRRSDHHHDGDGNLQRESLASQSSSYSSKRRSSRGTTIGIPHELLHAPKIELEVQEQERPLTMVLEKDLPWLAENS